MFIRKRVAFVKGGAASHRSFQWNQYIPRPWNKCPHVSEYYELLETYRDEDGKVKQEVITCLGPHSNFEEMIASHEEEKARVEKRLNEGPTDPLTLRMLQNEISRWERRISLAKELLEEYGDKIHSRPKTDAMKRQENEVYRKVIEYNNEQIKDLARRRREAEDRLKLGEKSEYWYKRPMKSDRRTKTGREYDKEYDELRIRWDERGKPGYEKGNREMEAKIRENDNL